MHKLEELKELLMEELSHYAESKKLDMAGLEIIDKLAHAIKNLCKIIDEGGYSSESMRSQEGMSGRRSYDSYRSYDRGSMDSYARGRGRYAKRDSMGRYSSEDDYSGAEEDFVDALRAMMKDLPEGKRRETQRFIEKIESMS